MNCRQARDLCADLHCDGSGWKTWNNIGRWTKALLDGDPDYPYDMSRPNRIAQLRRIAVMNIKKEGGGSRSANSTLEAAAKEQSAFIRQEIALCKPDMILCCGISSGNLTGNAVLLEKYVFQIHAEWKAFDSAVEGRKWWYYYADVAGRQIPVVSFCHPQATVLGKARGHENLFKPHYQDMLTIRNIFLQGKRG